MAFKIKENRTIVLPIEEKNYDLFVNDLDTAHRVISVRILNSTLPKRSHSMYYKNGTCDVVLSKEYKGQLVPARGRQCSSEQMPFIKEKFPTYNAFANANIEEIYGKQSLEESLHLQATEFHSLVLKNTGVGSFESMYLPNEAQVAPINGIIVHDVNKDRKIDLIVAGNNYDTEVETPRYDAGNGLVLLGKGDGNFTPLPISESGLFLPGNVKDLALIKGANQQPRYLFATQNNGPVEIFEFKTPSDGALGMK